MTIEQVKQAYQDGLMGMLEAKAESKKAGFNMVKLGASKTSGLGGKWAWFKA